VLGKVATITALSVLIGQIEEFRSKKIDAIQSLNTSFPEFVSARRRFLNKRCESLMQLAIKMHSLAKITSQSMVVAQ
jgi:hypothetical protein